MSSRRPSLAKMASKQSRSGMGSRWRPSGSMSGAVATGGLRQPCRQPWRHGDLMLISQLRLPLWGTVPAGRALRRGKNVEIACLGFRPKAAPATRIVAASWVVRLDDFRAEIAQHHGGHGERPGPAEVDDVFVFQRADQLVHRWDCLVILIPLRSRSTTSGWQH